MGRIGRREVLRGVVMGVSVVVAGCLDPGFGPGDRTRGPGGPTSDGQGQPGGDERGPMEPQGTMGPQDGMGPGGQGRTASGAGASGNATGEGEFGGWFDDVDNYDGVTDRTGRGAVPVAVGAAGNGGYYAYDPAAVRVSQGTTVVWEWTGEGGGHDVVAVDGSFESDLASEAGATFEYVFSETGRYRYYCTPHRSLGMKGAVVVV